MVNSFQGRASDRKLRLFACACFRAMAEHFPEGDNAVAVAESFAEGLASQEEMEGAGPGVEDALPPVEWDLLRALDSLVDQDAINAACVTADNVALARGQLEMIRAMQSRGELRPSTASRSASEAAEQVARQGQSDLLRCILGNPNRPTTSDPSWRTTAAVVLAGAIYERREFGRLPELARILEEAGCADPAVLAHCRRPGEHTRGCWVVDLLLGKE
jgi:hypothetical protein